MITASVKCQHCGSGNDNDARFCGSCGQATSATEPSRVGDLPSVSPAPEMAGREIAGRYRVLTKLGEGGMGAVYRGEQISLKRKCAIKLLRPELSADPGLVRRFNAEAELVAKLSHPNTVNIYDFGQDADGTLFIAMEYLDGRSLRQLIAGEGPVPPLRALYIAQQIAASLSDAHSHGIVHRDLKPDNVMLTERGRSKDIVRVLDFGIAKLRDEQNKTQAINPMTRAGDMVGTPQYMAPEQIRGEQVDGRTDVYALGAIVYEMVTGRLPFEGPSLMAILSRHLLDPPELPSRRRPDLAIPEPIDALVVEMLAKEPGQRMASMEAVSERFGQVAVALGGSATWNHPTGAGTAASSAVVGAVGTPPPTGVPMQLPHKAMSRPPGVPQTLPPGAMKAPPEGRAQAVIPTAPPGMAPGPGQAPTNVHGHAPMHQPQHPPHPIHPPMQQPVMQPFAPHGAMPMHGQVPPGMVVVPHPGYAPPQRKSGAWLWILVVLAIGGITAAAVYVALKQKDKKEATNSGGDGDDVVDRGGGGGGGDDDFDPGGGDDVFDPGGGDIAPIPLDGDVIVLGPWTVTLPLGFIEDPSSASAEGKIYAGTIEGNYTRIAVMVVTGNSATSSSMELDQACSDIATNYFAGTRLASSMISNKGTQFYRCTMSGNGVTAEGALYGSGYNTLMVILAADPYAFETMAGVRAELFDQRVVGSGG